MNKVQLTGRIASDIALKVTNNGVSNCSFRIASQRRFKNAEGNYEADFISCVAWRGTADFISKYFHKGDPIEIVGCIQTRNYEKDGQRIYVTEVLVEEAGFGVGGKSTEGQSNESHIDAPGAHATIGSSFDFSSISASDGFVPMGSADDDLPF